MMDVDTRNAFAEGLSHIVSARNPTALVASTIGGILLAVETGKRMRLPVLIARRVANVLTWINKGDFAERDLSRVILVDDILTTGGSLETVIRSLNEAGATVVATAVAVDRSDGAQVTLDNIKYDNIYLIRLGLNRWDPSSCPICPKPYVNLQNPEEDFLSVVLSMPPAMSGKIIDGYKQVYLLQDDKEQVQMIDQWKPWLPSLLAGLPLSRIGEDSGLVQFIRRYVNYDETDVIKKRVLTELVGHLLVISNIRVEARTLGCSILLGDQRTLLNALHSNAPVRAPDGVRSSNLTELIPYYDALPETEAAFLINKDGELFAIKRLVRSMEGSETRGIQLLRQITGDCKAIGLVVRRDSKALSVYREGRLEAVAELSEKTGVWEFTTPRPIVDEIDSRVHDVKRTLELILEVAREMVARGYGGMFVIGDVPRTLNRKPPTIKVDEQPLSFLGTGMLAEIAKLDGAMFISRDGCLQDASVIIINTGDDSHVAGLSDIAPRSLAGGSRKETAYRTSKECPEAAVVCVSQNGSIEIYVNGDSWPVSEAIMGVGR